MKKQMTAPAANAAATTITDIGATSSRSPYRKRNRIECMGVIRVSA